MLTALRTVQVLNKNRPEDDVSGHFIRGYVTALLRGTPELTRQVIGIETADRRYLWDPNHESMHQFCLRMGKEPEILATRDKSMDGRLVKNMLLSRIADRHTIEFIDKHLDQELLQ
jgi:hypothetical protein